MVTPIVKELINYFLNVHKSGPAIGGSKSLNCRCKCH